jgi:hypothetical protein
MALYVINHNSTLKAVSMLDSAGQPEEINVQPKAKVEVLRGWKLNPAVSTPGIELRDSANANQAAAPKYPNAVPKVSAPS